MTQQPQPPTVAPPTSLQARLAESQPWTVVTERDLTYLRLTPHLPHPQPTHPHDCEVLVIACDSDGGLGPKPADTVPVDPADLGRFATRVPMLELVAAGAEPVVVVDTLSVEMEPTGRQILAGVLAEAADAGVAQNAVTGSTEDNVPTVATGVGVTIIGRARLNELRVGSAHPPFAVLLLGRPMSAPAQRFGPADPDVLNVPALRRALSTPGIIEALPIGSRGVLHEYHQLARSAGATPRPILETWPITPEQSGGPSTACLLATKPPTAMHDSDLADWAQTVAVQIAHTTELPCWLLGTAS